MNILDRKIIISITKPSIFFEWVMSEAIREYRDVNGETIDLDWGTITEVYSSEYTYALSRNQSYFMYPRGDKCTSYDGVEGFPEDMMRHYIERRFMT